MLRTPLHQYHLDHGAQMVEFAGWEMPIRYKWPAEFGTGGGIIDEHNQVRKSGGFFDVSHMGRVRFHGRHARRLLERVCTRRISDMQAGQCRYSLVCNERGGVRDDVLVYRIDDDDFLVVVNASNREKLNAHFKEAQGDLICTIDDRTTQTAMVAIQGPNVMEMIGRFSREIPTLKRYRFVEKNYLIMKLTVSRTGYTGEDGVEVILPAPMVGMALKMMFKDLGEGDAAIVKPAGLGCRDTLRMEAAMPLYGHELGEDFSALAAGIDFAINLDKADDARGEAFIGMEALKKTAAAGGPPQKLVGIALEGPRAARQGMEVHAGGKAVGTVTSGCVSPTLGKSIAMAYVDAGATAEGAAMEVDTGKGTRLVGSVVPMPFYKRPAAAK